MYKEAMVKLFDSKKTNPNRIPYAFIMSAWNSNWQFNINRQDVYRLLDGYVGRRDRIEYFTVWNELLNKAIHYCNDGAIYTLFQDENCNLFAQLSIKTMPKTSPTSQKTDSGTVQRSYT